MKKKKETTKLFKDKTITIVIFKIMYILLLGLMLYNVIFLINTTISNKDYLSLFGISLIVTNENNMEPEIGKNSLIIVSNKQEELKIGQNISYVVNGQVRTNKIINIKEIDGRTEYITKSNKNYYQDIEKITYKMIIGKEIFTIWGLGFVIKIIQSKLFSIFTIVFLILKFIYNKKVYKNVNRRRRKINR